MKQDNMYWLKITHKELKNSGLPVKDFVLTRGKRPKILEDIDANEVPLISLEDLLPTTWTRQNAKARAIQKFKEKISESDKSFFNDSFEQTYQKNESYLKIMMDRVIFMYDKSPRAYNDLYLFCRKPTNKKTEQVEWGYVLCEDFVYPYSLLSAAGRTKEELILSMVFPKRQLIQDDIEKKQQDWSPQECADFIVKSITTFYKLI